MKRALSIGAVIGLCAAGSAFAGPIEDSFRKIDSGDDGTISRAEFVAYQLRTGRVSERQAVRQFGQLSGPDGLITIDEFRAGPNRPVNVRPRTASRGTAPSAPAAPRPTSRGFGS